MNQFLFDLQRFAATIRSSGVTNNSDGSITLSTNGNTSKTFTITVDGVTTTYTLWVNGSTTIWTDDNGAITLSVTSGFVHQLLNGSSAPNVTLKTGNGIFRPYFAQVIAFENSNAEFYFTTGNNNSNTLNVTDTTITVNGSDSNSREFVFGDLKYKSTQNISNVTISIDSSKNYSMNIGTSSRATLSYDKDSDFANTLTPTSGTITVKGDSDGNLYVTALDASDTFTIGDVTYTLSGVLLKATNSSSANKYYPHKVSSSTEIPLTALDFTSGELVSIYMAISGTLTISAEELDKLDEDTVAVADSNSSDFGALYGKLTKDDDTKTITLERTDEDDQYGAIVIEGDYNVVLSSTITNVPITVNNTSTTFSVTNTDSDFTVPSSVSPLTVGGATGLSLRSGTLLTSLSAQTIAASSYSVYGYNDTSSSPDGITVQRDGSTVIVGDIDAGESFSVSTASGISGYTMLSGNSGLLEQTNGVYKAYDSTGSVTLGSAGNPLIAPDGTGLEIGSTNTYSAAVFNSTSEPTTKYALLTADSGAYSLSTYSGDDGSTFQSNVSTISLLGGQTTIDKALVSNSTNIVTKTTTFLVTNVSGDTFVVSSGTATAPTISGATAITLQSGSITTTAGQTITLNGLSRTVTSSSDGVVIAISDSSATITAAAGKTFNIGSDSFTVDSNNTSGMTVTVTADTMTIAAGAGDSFTVGGETYTVGELSDGVTFAVDSTGKVTTISDLNTLNDAFNYNNTTGYSVMGAGFLREVSSVPNIWNKEGTTHSLTGGTVSVSDLSSTSNWLGLVIVQDDSITLSPSGTDNGLLIDEQYSKTYGTLIKGDNSYTITNTSNTDVALDNISINSGSSSFTLTVDDAFPNITISAPKADFAVTATNGDYQVTLTNDNMGLVNATAVSLVKGTLTADSLLSGGVLVDSKTFIPAQEVTVMTDSAGGDASIAGLSYGEKFSLNSNSYTFTGSGLRKADQLLRGSKTSSSIDNTLGLDSVTSDSAEWLGMIKASVDGGVSIKSSGNTTGFLVDNYNDTLQPSKLYGELTTVEGGYYLASADNYDAWDSSYTITISNTKASLSSIFAQSSIRGAQAGASFKVDSLTTSGADFTVADATGGVSLSGAKTITQSDGLIAVSASSIQSVVVGSDTIYNSNNLALDVSASGGNAATLSSLDEGENFTINSTGYSIISGLGLRTDDLFFKDSTLSTFNSATLAELTTLTDYNEWIYIAAIKDNILTVPPTIDSSAGEWLVLDNTKSTKYTNRPAWYRAAVLGGGSSTINRLKWYRILLDFF